MSGDYVLIKYDLAVHRQRNEPVLDVANVKPVGDSYAGMTRQQRALSQRKKIIP